MTWRGRRVLVTGAAGFLGGRLAARLAAAGADVGGVSRRRRTARPELRWWRADLGDLAATRRVVRAARPEIVYHLAGHVSAAPGVELVVPTFRSLLAGTVHLLTALTDSPCRRIVVVGSLTEPGARGGNPSPGSPYVAAKWAASAYAHMFHLLYALPVVVVRPGMAYGPHQPAGKLVPSVIHAALRGESPALASGRLRADWVYVDDLVAGLMAAGRRSGITGRGVDLGSGRQITVRHLVRTLLRLMGDPVRPRWGARADRPSEVVRAADLRAAARILGWRPRVDLETGLRRTIAWERRTGRFAG